METVKLSAIKPDAHNANAHTERGTYMLRKSMERFGFLEPGILDAENNIIGGNHRAEAAADVLDAGEAIVIDIDGTRPVFVRRKDLLLDSPEGREAAIALNRTAQVGIEFDPLVLEDYHAAGVDMSDWFQIGELRDLGLDIDVTGKVNRPDYGELLADMMGDLPMPEGVPDTLWPTDNDWGIPLLDIERQADAFDVPIERWGSQSRKGKVGTWHFYTDDYRFEGVWAKPDQLVQAGCVNAVEPNFSVYDQFPRAVALWATFRKRWLARYWQSRGIRIFVDLNVARPYDDLNLMGVPKGWRAYATRGYTERIEALDDELAIARAHAGTDSVLFMCYGGGDAISEWCKQNGAVWVASDFNRKRGKYLNSYADEV